MAIQRKTWIYNPPKPKKPKIPEDLKNLVDEKAKQLVETVLKPEFVKPPIEGSDSSYLVDIYTEWYRSYFYFCGKSRCPAPNCIREFYERKFARLEYVGDNKFNFAYMRHTEQWWETRKERDLDECLEAVEKTIFFF